MTIGRRGWWAACLGFAIVLPAFAAEDDAVRIERLRASLSALQFEEVLKDSATFLDEDGHARPDRAAVWAIRAEAHAAVGDLKGAERDFEQVLRLQPSWRPDPARISKKARERFEALRREAVGTLRLTVEPPGARVTLADDPGVVLVPDEQGRFALHAGSAVVRVEFDGHDSWEDTVEIPAGGEVERHVVLVPNARDLVVRARPVGVRVRLDGREIGATQPTAETGVGELTIPDAAVGDHVVELDKPCFREARRTILVRVGLLDPGPQTVDLGELEPALAPITVSGAIEGGTVLLDGDPRGGLPAADLLACAGLRTIEVRVRDRVVYREQVDVVPGTAVRLQALPRWNVVWVGDAWPAGTAGLRSISNDLGAVPSPRGDLAELSTWRELRLPESAQVAFAVRPGRGIATPSSWWAYSPALDRLEALEVEPSLDLVPAMVTQSLPLTVVDSARYGGAIVVACASPDVRPGDRVVAVAGVPVDSRAAYDASVARSTPGAKVALTLERGSDRRTVEVAGQAAPRLAPAGEGSAVLRAAWAEQIALADATLAPTALANLGVLLSAAGRHGQAAEMWQRVRFPPRQGVSDGTAAYYLGAELAAAGRTRDAVEALRRAASSDATAPHDGGLPVSPAARDRLRDLGVR